MEKDYDYIVIGSGFGGSVSALRLAEKGYRVAVFEMGKWWTPENLPKSNWSLAKWLWQPTLGLRGFFGMRFFKHIVVLHGNAVGGGSITYANTLLEPSEKFWNQGTWAELNKWSEVMPRFYQTARFMLGVTQNKILAPADLKLQAMAKAAGVEKSFYATDVGIFFGDEKDEPGTSYDDPYFNGEGPTRKSCIGCGACMIGCRHGAKNSLDQNYLYLAQKRGARILAESKVTDVIPIDDGYEVTVNSRQKFTTKGVVFAASSLGTQDLLFKLKQKGSLPLISETLGAQVRTNAESLIGVRFPGSKEDLSKGIAIGSGIYIDEHTHIEATRYPEGSDFMGLISTVMTLGRPGLTRPLTWLTTLLKLLLTKPLTTLRSLKPWGWARESMIFLCMQTVDAHLMMKRKRRWYWPFSSRLVTSGPAIPTFIPAANTFALKAAEAMGGIPMTSMPEIFLNIPMTAHCIGGAIMGKNSREGVCDFKSQVFGYQNMYICDGSVIGANLGVNPSLTITALAEHAMSYIPEKN